MSVDPDVFGGAACLRTLAVFVLVVSPLLLLLRVFVKAIRQAYGFDPVPPDDGPPLRICSQCNNTVMERDFQHCPYCGATMPDAGEATA